MQPTEQKFTDILERLFKLWAETIHPNAKTEFIEYCPHHDGDSHNPEIRFRINGEGKNKNIEWFIQEIWGRINAEKANSGQPVTRNL